MKYIIEDNLNFFDLLHNQEINKDEEKKDVCLITGEQLKDHFITMECNHKFNYIPLYNDLRYHKFELNSNELSGKLCYNEIRCPYCRTKSFQLIPYYENIEIIPHLFVRSILGINMYYDGTENTDTIRSLQKKEKFMQRKENGLIQKYFQKQFVMEQKEIQKQQEKLLKIKQKEESKLLKLKLKEEEKQKKMLLKQMKKQNKVIKT
jgi:hypothetical protein